ncbi:hypothetical protein [Flavobacterium sp. 25HG05S-40]|uniref:hypothetical protein n=1 Tax=Flavobacterium sp. 25HG05S-40 TaxID=3458682 RepID=UPI004044FD21
MSYKVYINGNEVEQKDKLSFPFNKQANDIADLTTRNSSFSPTIKLPKSARNKRIFDYVGNVGSQSLLPYRKVACDVIDADNGVHLVYKGWAVLNETTADYSVTIYDGIIDFYKAIENLTITDIGVTDLNHVKSISSVVETWNDTSLPYRYNLADYNGNNLTVDSNANIDFQVPSASVKYIWDRIFAFLGWTYSGSVFSHEKFNNLWLSYPKPVSLETPIVNEVTEQFGTYVTDVVEWPVGTAGVFIGSVTYCLFLPNTSSAAIDPAYYVFTTGAVQAGLYRYSFTAGVFELASDAGVITSSRVRLVVVDSLGATVSSNYVDISTANYKDIYLNVGERVLVQLVRMDSDSQLIAQVTPTFMSFLSGGPVTTTVVKIDGYSLGFDQAFIDYKVTDFVRQILVDFGLTPFKDKYSNNVNFLTSYELLQTSKIVDWSNKNPVWLGEKYSFGKYAKRNLFKKKYNDDNMKHNDGFITIDNENLDEEVTIFSSAIFSPERLKSKFLNGSNIYKIWEKQIKEDNSIEYKDLDGRFYFMRSEKVNSSITVGSTILGGDETNAFYYRESYYRLDYNSILNDWYAPMLAIFNKAKLLNYSVHLSMLEFFNFDMASLVYIKQRGSYYLVNKFKNFVKGRPTNVELIEVDYYTAGQIGNPVDPIDYTISIGEPTIESCSIIIPVTTDYPEPGELELVVYAGSFDVFSGTIYTETVFLPVQTAAIVGGNVTFSLAQFPANPFGYKFGLRINNTTAFEFIYSNLTDSIELDGSCYEEPVITELEITAVEMVTDNGMSKTYNIEFASDVPLPVMLMMRYYQTPTGTFPLMFGGWSDYVSYLATDNNFDAEVGTIFGDPIKFQIKIGAVESAEFVV